MNRVSVEEIVKVLEAHGNKVPSWFLDLAASYGKIGSGDAVVSVTLENPTNQHLFAVRTDAVL